jgi:hypothetical protein
MLHLLRLSFMQSNGGELVTVPQECLAQPTKAAPDGLVRHVNAAAAEGIVQNVLNLHKCPVACGEEERAAQLKHPLVCGTRIEPRTAK